MLLVRARKVREAFSVATQAARASPDRRAKLLPLAVPFPLFSGRAIAWTRAAVLLLLGSTIVFSGRLALPLLLLLLIPLSMFIVWLRLCVYVYPFRRGGNRSDGSSRRALG